jgi:hypothetical protein
VCVLFESCGELGRRGSDALTEIRRLSLLPPLELDKKRSSIADLWWRACCQAVEVQDFGWLDQQWPGPAPIRTPLNVIAYSDEIGARARAMAGLARVAILLVTQEKPETDVLHELREAAAAWPRAVGTPTLAIGRVRTGESNAYVADAIRMIGRLGGDAATLDLLSVRELLLELLGDTQWNDSTTVEARLLLAHSEGLVGTFHVESRAGGTGQCFRDPRDLTGLVLGDRFRGSLTTAWDFTRAYRESESSVSQRDVRWRVTVPGGDLPDIEGPSAGACFAVAFVAATGPKAIRIDPRVAVVGEVDAEGQIHSVHPLSYRTKLAAARKAELRVVLPSDDRAAASEIAPRLQLLAAVDVSEALLKASARADPYGFGPGPAKYEESPSFLRAVEAVEVALAAGSEPVTVVGPEGSGKSVLVHAVAQSDRIRRTFVDGVIRVPPHVPEVSGPEFSAEASEANQPLTAIVAAVEDVLAGSGVDAAADRLRKAVKRRAVLLVIDNASASQPMHAFTQLDDDVRVLVASRDARVARVLGGTVVPIRPPSSIPARVTAVFVLLSAIFTTWSYLHRGSTVPSSGTLSVQGQEVHPDRAVPLDLRRRIPVRFTGGQTPQADEVHLVFRVGGLPICVGPLSRITALCPSADMATSSRAFNATLDAQPARFFIAGRAKAELRLRDCDAAVCIFRFDVVPIRHNGLGLTPPIAVAAALLGFCIYATKRALDPSDVRRPGVQVATVLVPWAVLLRVVVWLLGGVNPLGTAIWLSVAAAVAVALAIRSSG